MKKFWMVALFALLIMPIASFAAVDNDLDLTINVPSMFDTTITPDPCDPIVNPTVADMINGSIDSPAACTFDIVSNVEWTLSIVADNANWKEAGVAQPAHPVDNITVEIDDGAGDVHSVITNGVTTVYVEGDGTLGTGILPTAGTTYDLNFSIDLGVFDDDGVWTTILTITLIATS